MTWFRGNLWAALQVGKSGFMEKRTNHANGLLQAQTLDLDAVGQPGQQAAWRPRIQQHEDAPV